MYQLKFLLRPIPISVFLAIAFWLFLSAVDAYSGKETGSFVASLFSPEASELWLRSLVSSVLVGCGAVVCYFFTNKKKVQQELAYYKDSLERLVDERTSELLASNEELLKLASTDPLTKIYNRRKFNEALSYEIDRDKRYCQGFCLLLCDIDHFKAINDKHGHAVGDIVLIEFTKIVQSLIRSTDLFGRWGGEEFILLLPATDEEGAFVVSDKIRDAVEKQKFNVVGDITISIGVSLHSKGDKMDDLIERADNALYQAKRNGRNKVVLG